MDYLFYSILLNVWVFIAFRSFKTFKMGILPAVITNYFVCALVGWAFTGFQALTLTAIIDAQWFPLAIIMGFLFISTFYTTALVTQRFGVSIASIATRMSMVIPAVFALFIFNFQTTSFSALNYLGLILALLAVILSSYPDKSNLTHRSKLNVLLLPMLVFILQGTIDALLNYGNAMLVPEKDAKLFTTIIFLTAGSVGTIIMIYRRESFRIRSMIGGVYLGIPNYFSIYFILLALSAFDNSGAFLFPMLNTGIIVVASLVAILLFHEKLNKLNYLGILLAILAIYLISYQEIHLTLNDGK